MKNWMKKIASLGILLTAISSFGNSFASDSIDWNQASTTLTYDYYAKALKVQIIVPYGSTPGSQYQANMVINGKTYSQTFSKYSVTNKLYVEQSVPIAIIDLAPNYTINLNVVNKNSQAGVFQNTYTPVVNNYVNWNGTLIYANYNITTQYLEIRATLENVASSPSSIQYSHITIAGKTNQATFNYDSSNKKLDALHKIYIPNSEVLSSYGYYWQAKDASGNSIVSKSGSIQTGYGSNSNDPLSWSNIHIEKNYDTSYQRLSLTYTLPNISSLPRDTYSVKVSYNGTTYQQAFLYSSDSRSLYTNVYIPMNSSQYQSLGTVNFEVYNDTTKTYVYSNNSNQCSPNCGGTSLLPNWNQLSITNTYSSSAQQLSVFFQVNQVSLQNSESYTLRAIINGSNYTKTFDYYAGEGALKTTIVTSISPAYLQQNYTITYSITKNGESNPLYNGTTSMALNNTQNNSTPTPASPNFSWNNSDIDNAYDTQEKVLNISIGWEGMNTAPSNAYSVKLFINNKYYIKDLRYSSTYKKFFTQFQIPIAPTALSSRYTISYQVINESTGNISWSKNNISISVKSDGTTSSTTSQATQTYDVSEATLSKSVSKFILAFEKKYTTNSKRLSELQKLIKQLKLYSLKHAKYANVCNKLIEKFESQLNIYESRNSKADESTDILDFLIEQSK